MKPRILAAAVLATIAFASAGAMAHPDPNADPQRCDRWWRPGHGTGTGNNNYPSHEHQSSSDVVVGDPAGTRIHGQSGHYVVRNQYGYVEVVGGQSYRGPDPQGNSFPGQGGYVQGEVDVAEGAPDVDFFAATFGPDDGQIPPDDPVQWAVFDGYTKGCVNVAGQQVEQQSREP